MTFGFTRSEEPGGDQRGHLRAPDQGHRQNAAKLQPPGGLDALCRQVFGPSMLPGEGEQRLSHSEFTTRCRVA